MKKTLFATAAMTAFVASFSTNVNASSVYESADILTPVEALGRFQWLDKCYRGLLLEVADNIFNVTTPIPNDQKIANLRDALLYRDGVLRSDANYLSFGNADNENPDRWFAGRSASIGCYQIPSDYGVSAILVSNKLANYCDAKANDYEYEYIKSIEFADVTNESSNSAYSNFPGQAAILYKNRQYEMTMTPGFVYPDESYPETWHVFVDWNQDGDFLDSKEGNYAGYSDGALSYDLTPPSAAKTGLTKMRITMDYLGGKRDACKNIGAGEVEDYVLYIK
jgi:hypothetical protein